MMNQGVRLGGLLLLLGLVSCVSSPSRQAAETDGIKGLSQADQIRALKGKGPRRRVLVLPFINETQEKAESIAREARSTFVRGLRMTDGYVIVDNRDVPRDLGSFLKNNEYDLAEVSKVANDLGVTAVIEGRVIEIKAKKTGDEVGVFRSVKARVSTTVSLRVFSTANRREILNDVRSASADSTATRVGQYSREDRDLAADPELIRECLTKAFMGTILPVTKAVDKISWDGKIASISGDRIYVNAGRLSGIQVGDILKVSDSGEEVYDPDTGLLIGKAPGRMKGTLEIVSYFGKDGSVAVVHSGSGFKENDVVELY